MKNIVFKLMLGVFDFIKYQAIINIFNNTLFFLFQAVIFLIYY